MLRRFCQRLIALIRRDRVEQDLAREVGAHLTLLEDDYRNRGLSDDEARRRARLALGGIDQTKERHRDERSFPWLEDVRRDVPYAIRGLRRTPGFTVAAVLTLALGIGATTAILSVVNSVFLRPLPYPDSDRIVQVSTVEAPPESGRPAPPRNITYAEFVEWRERTTTLSPVAATSWDPQVMAPTPRGTARFSGGLVTPEWFELLGTTAMIGRTLIPADVAEDRQVAVLSARAWRQHFASDPDILGKTLTLHSRISTLMHGQAVQIVGVMPDDFVDPAGYFEFWIPLVISDRSPSSRAGVRVFGRLRPGVAMDQAADEATLLFSAIRKAAGTPGSERPGHMTIESIKAQKVDPAREALQVLLAAVAFVLVIICANLACLLLARGSSRHREIAVRLAIGGSRGRIVRQLLTESVVLATAGGLLGALVGAAGIAVLRALTTIQPQGVFRLAFGGDLIPRASEIAVDGQVLLIAIGVTAATSVLFGLAPAIQASRADIRQATIPRIGRPAGEGRLRSALVVGQLTMATVLLIGAALLIRSFVRLSDVDTGYDPDGVLAFQLVLPEDEQTARKAAAIEEILARLRASPDIEVAGFSNAGALVGLVDRSGYFVPPGRSAEEMRQDPRTPQVRSISGDYLRAMGIPLIAGRTFSLGDNAGAPPVAIINRVLASQYFGDANPVGTTMAWYGGPDGTPPVMLQVIGVIENVRHGRLQQEATPEVIFDYRQMLELKARWNTSKRAQELLAFGFMSFAVRTTGDPAALAPAVRTAVARAHPGAGLDAVAPMTELVSTSIARPRFYAALLGVFAAIAAVLAAIGIYGVLAYAVVQRTHEIGVRMALGASRPDVIRLVQRRGVALAAIGIGLGLVGAAGLSRYLEGLLFGLTRLDVMTYAVVASGFAAVALAASWLPARRATRVDPTVALRAE